MPSRFQSLKKALVLTGALFIALNAYAQIKVAVIDSHSSHPHRKQIEKIFQQYADPKIEVSYWDLYEANGELLEETFLKSMAKAHEADIVHLSWNLPDGPAFKKIKSALQKLAKHKILIAASGAPSGRELSALLSTTVMGQVKDAFLIGELKRGKLAQNSYQGKELFTALEAPAGQPGSSFSSALFAAALAKAILKEPQKNWKVFLKNHKASSHEAFPFRNFPATHAAGQVR